MAFEFVDEAPQEPAGRFEFVDEPAAPVQTIQATKPQPTGMAAFGKAAYEGLTAPARGVLNLVGLIPDEEINRRRVENQYLNESGAGMAGTVAGTVAGLAGSGVGLKLAGKGAGYVSPRVGAALEKLGISLIAPKTALQAGAGGSFAGGILTPATSASERLLNTVAGGVGGVVGQGAGNLIGGGIGKATQGVQRAAVRRVDPVLRYADALPEVERAAAGMGLKYRDLPAEFQQRIQMEVINAQNIGSDMPVESLVRKALYESQGLKPTKAMITRSQGDALTEQNLLTEPEGLPLQNIYADNNRAVRERIRSLAPEGVQPVEVPEFGAKLRTDIRGQERAAQREVGGMYTAAKEAEGANIADVTDLANFIGQNKSRLAASGDQGKFVLGYMQDMGILDKELAGAIKGGKASATGAEMPLTQLTDLRSIVNQAWRDAPDANSKSVLDSMRQILNKAEWQAGGQKFKSAREARAAKATKFEANPLIDQLLSKKKGYNADLIEDSQVFDRAILGSTPEQFAHAWKAVGDEKTRDLTRAQVANWIESQVYGGQAMNQTDVIASSAKLAQSLKKLGPQKLRAIYGDKAAAELQLLQKSVQEISNPPKGTVPQGSAPKLSFLNRQILGLLGMTPGVGQFAAAAGKAAELGMQSKAAEKAAKAAIEPVVAAPMRAARIPLTTTAGIGTATPLAQWLLNPSAASGQ
jgi:hypothetical protein